jgi:hypothetical protein
MWVAIRFYAGFSYITLSRVIEEKLRDTNYHLLGDSAYRLGIIRLITLPQQRAFNPGNNVQYEVYSVLTIFLLFKAQRYFNSRHSRQRCLIERSFGLLKGKRRKLKYLDITNLDCKFTQIYTANSFE